MGVGTLSTPETDTNNSTPTSTMIGSMPTTVPLEPKSTDSDHRPERILFVPARECPGKQRLDANGECREPL